MCIACEMGFWSMFDAMSPEAQQQYLREEAARFACEAIEGETPQAGPQPSPDERKP